MCETVKQISSTFDMTLWAFRVLTTYCGLLYDTVKSGKWVATF